MKKIDKIFDLKKLAKKLTALRADDTVPEWCLLAPVLDAPLTLDKINALLEEWGINEKELPPVPDPATKWQLFTKLANDCIEDMRSIINRILEKEGKEAFHGPLEFRMVLDGSFGLYCNTEIEVEISRTPHSGDVVVERLSDGSYVIEEHNGEALGMADDWTSCVEFVADHFDGAGYWDEDFEYDINVFQREDGKLYLVNFNEFMTEEKPEEEGEEDAGKS